jgi:hypothetical protein
MINLFYLSDNTTGGWVTFTAHLMDGLAALGVETQLIKVRTKTESRLRTFGYGQLYRNVALRDAMGVVESAPSIIVALQKNHRDSALALAGAGAWMVVHDPAEFKHLGDTPTDRCLTIRRTVQGALPGSHLLPHPYGRCRPAGSRPTGEWRAVSVCRIDFDKNTHILLDANRLLPDAMKINIHGFENRIYTRFKVTPNYPEWRQSEVAFPREAGAAVRLCGRATYAVDMSLIKGDGGGTQYSFMEAMDAGSVNIVHRGWILPDDEMVPYPEPEANCLAVESGSELSRVLRDGGLRRAVVPALAASGERLLARHRPDVVAGALLRTLGVGLPRRAPQPLQGRKPIGHV